MLQQTVNLDNWLLKASPLEEDDLFGKRRFASTQRFNGRVLAFGGYGDSKDSLTSIHEVDMHAKSIEPIGNMLNARADFAVGYHRVGLSERMFCFGGKRIYNFGQQSELLQSVEVFDYNTRISHLHELLIPVDLGVTGQFVCQLNENLIMLAGGIRRDGQGSASIYVFDMLSERWTRQGTTLPIKTAYGCTAIRDGKVLMFGGINLNSNVFSSLVQYWKPSNLLITL